MRRFMIKMSLFFVPLLLLSANFSTYQKSGGDLNRIGKVTVQKDYRLIFSEAFSEPMRYREYSGLSPEARLGVDLLTIGDSFSQQGCYGYQNITAILRPLEIVNIDANHFRLDNPIQVLASIANGNFFDTIQPRFIILESIERRFAWRSLSIDRTAIVNREDFDHVYGRHPPTDENAHVTVGLDYFSDITKYFTYNLLHQFDPKAFFSQVYDMHLTGRMFSVRPDRLLFFHEDIANLRFGARGYTARLNTELNAIAEKLATRNITLIVLPGPDKYDLYSGFIENNTLPGNDFFNNMRLENKKYEYIDTKALLLPILAAGVLDVYFADDTHWSPVCSKIIAAEVLRRMDELESRRLASY